MIFDRTKEDVDRAVLLREQKVKMFQTLTEDDVETLERGMLTINTLNRIEDKQRELKMLLDGMGYWNTPVESKDWDYTQVFDFGDFQRIVKNTNFLRNAFFVFKNTPITPPVSYYFEDINSLEKILYDIEEMIEDMKSFYRECNTFECGEE